MKKKKGQLDMGWVVGIAIALVVFWLIVRFVSNGASSSGDSAIDIANQAADVNTDVDTGVGNTDSGGSSGSPSNSSGSLLSGSTFAQKVAYAAKEAGLDKPGAEVIMKMAFLESGYKHCCSTSGSNRANTCSPTQDLFCSYDNILTSYDGSSRGIMQLASGVHKPWFESDEISCRDSKYAQDCRVKTRAGCNGNTALNADCNIKIGIYFLSDLKDVYGKKGISFVCKDADRFYTGWDAALRKYNGMGCDEQYKYVELVNGVSSSHYKAALDEVYG